MDLFEYQGKQLLSGARVPVPQGEVADTPDEAAAAADRLGYPVAVKAQVRVGGRGKAGGIRLAHDGEQARAHAGAILGLTIGGHPVRRLWIERATDIAHEYYVSFALDRAGQGHLGLASAQGGVDIEAVSAAEPSAVVRMPIDPLVGLTAEAAADLAGQVGFAAAASTLVDLYRAFVTADAELVEVNPLIATAGGSVVALDAKVSLDDNARFRHPEWDAWATAEWHDERERLARARGLNYVGLDGNVGVIGNGAGLVLATLDVVSEVGGRAANFLDVGGGASAAVMAAALEVVAGDPGVRSILVNIFGGITRGEEVANGIVAALETVDVAWPIVVRLDGTNAEEGRAILAAASVPTERLVSEPTMLEAAHTAVRLAGAAGVGAAGVGAAGVDGS